MILNEVCSADDERLFDTDGGDGIFMMIMIMIHCIGAPLVSLSLQ